MPDLTAATSDQFQQILAAVRLFAQDTEANDALGAVVSEAYSLGITVGQGRVFAHLTAERDRLAGELVNAHVERDEYRERMNDLVDERDGLDGELTAARAEVERLTDERDKLAAGNTAWRQWSELWRSAATPAALAEARQELANRGTGYVPAWDDLNDHARQMATREAANWLKALRSVRVAPPFPGSSLRAPEPTDVTIRGVRVCLPDERRGADPDRPVRIVVAGVAYSDLNADEARGVAAALVAAAGESQASEPAPAEQSRLAARQRCMTTTHLDAPCGPHCVVADLAPGGIIRRDTVTMVGEQAGEAGRG